MSKLRFVLERNSGAIVPKQRSKTEPCTVDDPFSVDTPSPLLFSHHQHQLLFENSFTFVTAHHRLPSVDIGNLRGSDDRENACKRSPKISSTGQALQDHVVLLAWLTRHPMVLAPLTHMPPVNSMAVVRDSPSLPEQNVDRNCNTRSSTRMHTTVAIGAMCRSHWKATKGILSHSCPKILQSTQIGSANGKTQ